MELLETIKKFSTFLIIKQKKLIGKMRILVVWKNLRLNLNCNTHKYVFVKFIWNTRTKKMAN